MAEKVRTPKRITNPRLESLESRNLMSVLINAKPTLEVLPQGNRVREARGAISITQPVAITVTGTAQPPTSNVQIVVQIYAKDANGNLVNGGAPLATAVPDFSGEYTATLSFPSKLRKDVNILFAREVAVGSLDSTLTINPTTLRNLAATISNPGTTSTLDGTFVTPATPITGIGGTITTPAFPINTVGGAGTAGPAVSTLLGGTGTLDAQVGTIVGGSVVTPPSTSNLTGGTGDIAATTGTATLLVSEVAVSEPITVLVHQSQRIPGSTLRTRAKILAGREGGSRLHPTSSAGSHALAIHARKVYRHGHRG